MMEAFRRSTVMLVTLSGFIFMMAIAMPHSSIASNVLIQRANMASARVIVPSPQSAPLPFTTIDIQAAYNYQDINGLNRDLKIGDVGMDVRLVQATLNKLLPDFPAKYIDGKYGTLTYVGVAKFQKRQGLTVTGRLDSATRSNMNDIFFKKLCPASNGAGIVFPDEVLIKVDRQTALPKDFVPKDLVRLSNGITNKGGGEIKTTNFICLKQEVIPHLERMIKDAVSQNIKLGLTSGFRGPEMQNVIYNMLIAEGGPGAKDAVALPLHSEHQLGTAIDFTSMAAKAPVSIAENYNSQIITNGAANIIANGVAIQKSELEPTGFDTTAEDYWLRANSYKYGFIMSYPKYKQEVTGYTYEPWHYRYVGIDVAKEIFDKKITIQEYFDSKVRAR